MKIVIMNYADSSIETISVFGDTADKLWNGDMDLEEYLSQRYQISEINWMLSQDDVIPVYRNGNSVPYTSV